MKRILTALLALISLSFADQAADSQAASLDQSTQKPVSSNQHPDAQWFPDAGLGLFIHWGLASVGATGDLSWGMLANKPWKDQTVTPNNYYGWAKQWEPDKVDYDTQLAQAKAAGFTYAVMVTKHHDGFTLWPSTHGDLGTTQFLGGRAFVQEFTDACRKHGLKVGLYYSPRPPAISTLRKSSTSPNPSRTENSTGTHPPENGKFSALPTLRPAQTRTHCLTN